VGLVWARKIRGKRPTALRLLMFAYNLVAVGLVGLLVCAGAATRRASGTPGAAVGRDGFLERRAPDWSPYPWHY
jgi:naphthoate synthase